MASFLVVVIEVVCVASLWFPSTEQNVEISYGQYCLKEQPVTSSPPEEKPVTFQVSTCLPFMNPSHSSLSPVSQPSTSQSPTSQPPTTQSSISQPLIHEPTIRKPSISQLSTTQSQATSTVQDRKVVAPEGIYSLPEIMNGCACSEVTQEPPLYHLIRSVQMTAPQLHCKTFLIIWILKQSDRIVCRVLQPTADKFFKSLTVYPLGVGHGCKCTQGKGHPIRTKVSSLDFYPISRQCRRIEITATMEQTYQTFCVSTDTPIVREFIHYINSFHSMDRY